MSKSLIIVAAAAIVVLFNKSKSERSANVGLSASDLDILIARIKADTELQQKLRGPAGTNAAAGKAKIEVAGVDSQFGGHYDPETEVFSSGGAFYIDFREVSGFSSRGDVFLRAEAIGVESIKATVFGVGQRWDSLINPDTPDARRIEVNNSFWTLQTPLNEDSEALIFKLGGTTGKAGVGAYEHLHGIFVQVGFSGFSGAPGDEMGIRFSIYGPGVETHEHTVIKIVS